MKVFNNTTRKIFLASWVLINQEIENEGNLTQHNPGKKFRCDILKPLRLWINNIEVRDREFAHRVCQVIPAQCPFERDVKLFGRTLFHIPPMCKLNPLYEEVVALRFRSLCYLADECGEDISQYC
ncbi:MAG: nitrogenase [Richelia sp. RM2_1_2]|nr:nitrogenase [Richelia sp. SM2_1_7]NJM23360.1 nitrogenase [Richelia sp. SM1_7_0]NJN07090.1 nitrogenase [Richelia sp. RM1_1_1]NJO29287.1 nitrogenase [Richelia sp. SL_2_1]NJO58452.1 nitrogenase [Richelia sp. RM2_1_2]NJS16561.1 nitrogenase [Nostocaceae cyanobacterium CSU_2_110]